MTAFIIGYAFFYGVYVQCFFIGLCELGVADTLRFRGLRVFALAMVMAIFWPAAFVAWCIREWKARGNAD